MNKLDIIKLDWDSSFFNFPIGTVNLVGANLPIEKIKKSISQNEYGFKLLYIYANPEDDNLNNNLRELGGILADNKITFRRQNFVQNQYSTNVVSIINKPITNEIESLALQSGEFSRFKKDTKIGLDTFNQLYRLWIENSLNCEIAFDVLAYVIGGETVGIITLGIKNNIGDIGLLAVDKKFRGLSIGKKLIDHALSIFYEKKILEVQVVTQLENKMACDFYKKNKFNQVDLINIYHLWLS